MSYTDIFGGAVIQPAQVSYLLIPLAANKVLSWPTDFQNINSVVADIMDVVPTANGFTLTLPDARTVSVGQSFLINNPSAFTFRLLTNDGANLLSPFPMGQVNYFYLIDNTTQAGTWRQSLWGAGTTAVTSINADAPDATDALNLIITGNPGLPITTAGTIDFALGADLAGFDAGTNLTGLTGFDGYGGSPIGIAVRIAGGVGTENWALRNLSATANQIVITNPNGVAGNPTFALANNIIGVNSITLQNLTLGVVDGNTISTLVGNLNLSANSGIVALPASGAGGSASTSLQFINGNGFSNTFSTGGTQAANFTFAWPLTGPTVGQVLSYTAANQLGWQSVSTIAGASTVGVFPVFTTTNGGLGNSTLTTDGAGNIAGALSLAVGNLRLGGTGSLGTIATSGGNLTLAPFGTNPVVIANDVQVTAASLTTACWPKAWVVFDGSANILGGAGVGSFGVTSVTTSATGVYTINFTTPFASSNYGFSWSLANGGATMIASSFMPASATVNTYNLAQTLTAFSRNFVVFYGNQ